MRVLASVLIAFFSFSAFCLPSGDYSYLPQLPQMFKQCKAHEDKDLNLIDFISDHLINFDCLIDKHTGSDHQKPHTPSLHHSVINIVLISPTDLRFQILKGFVKQAIRSDFIVNPLSKGHTVQVFRPPILAV
ncbi:MAG: hypothetical protein R2852_03890 [Bacteroidia bacterium]